ncbi:phospholipid carrier-dependent glycosyltransferase [bacterium]|nr:MAG: phospholipid carrier-dependent glycosyltransferase [bacterium]
MLSSEPISDKASRGLLALIVLLHVVLAIWFGLNTPYRTPGKLFINGKAPIADIGAPDERQHANYVARLVEGKGFPVFDFKSPDPEGIEYHQPPLYYGVAAAYAKIAGLSADTIRSPEGRSVRWIGLLFGALGIVGTYFLGRWGYGNRTVGLIAATFYALLPMNIALSGAVNNDPPLFALFAWTLALAALGVREGWTHKIALGCGVLAGLAILTKTTGLALLPILGCAALLRRPKLPELAAVLLPAILLPLPWLLRNNSLYGDPLGLQAFQLAFTQTAQASTFIDGMGFGLVGYLIHWLGWWTARSFFGVFGYMDVWLNETGSPYAGPNALYRILLALLVVAFIGWLLRVIESDREEKRVHILGTIAFAIVTLLFLRFGLQYFQAQARYLFPALAPIACGVAWGALRLSKGNWKVALAAVAMPLLAVALLAGSVLPSEFAKRM